MAEWQNLLLTDSGFYHDNELDKPIAVTSAEGYEVIG